MNISVATYNIRNTTDRYDERKPLLLDLIEGLQQPDISGYQEVRFERGDGLVDQTSELFSTSSRIVRSTLTQPFLSQLDPKFRIDGNCSVLNTSRCTLISDQSIALSPVRNAHRVVFEISAFKVSFCNVHLHHEFGAVHEQLRLQQITMTIDWLNALDESDNVDVCILAGDFNASPSEEAYAHVMSHQYRSCYREVHGCEPEKTFPTGLLADTMDTDPAITCDYVFVKGRKGISVQPVTAELFGNVASSLDPTLYPSDHIGVLATVRVQSV